MLKKSQQALFYSLIITRSYYEVYTCYAKHKALGKLL